MKLKENKEILVVIALFAIANIIASYNYKNIWWDSAVYIGIGKYLYSLGASGFFEPSRPILWPMIIGIFWKLGLDTMIFAKAIALIFSSGAIFMTYIIGKELFSKKTGLFASILLAMSPIFFFFTAIPLTEISSGFFALASIYSLIKKSPKAAGFLLGLAFLTRFFQIFMIIPIILILAYRKELKDVCEFLAAFAITISPYMIFNLVLYKNPIYPFILQAYMTSAAGFIYHQPWNFYIVELFKDSFLYVFALLGFVFIRSADMKKDYRKFILYLSLFLFLTYTLADHKEMRFTLSYLPYICIIASYSLFQLFRDVQLSHVLPLFIGLIMIMALRLPAVFPEDSGNNIESDASFQEYIRDKSGIIWVTSPIYALKYDKKIDELMYYPTFNIEKIAYLKSNMNKADYVLFNSCDLYCEPYFMKCRDEKADFISELKSSLRIAFENKENECEYFIFERPISSSA